MIKYPVKTKNIGKMKNISFLTLICLMLIISVNLSAQSRFDPVKAYSFIPGENSFLLKWYSTGKKPAPKARAFRYNEPGGTAAVAELTGKVVNYRVNDTSWFVYFDSVMWLPKGKIIQFFLVPHDTLGIAGEASEVLLAGNIGFSTASFTSVTTERAENTNAAVIKWKFNNPGTVKSYSVFRSTSRDTGFELIASLPAGETSHTDLNLVPDQLYYYYIEAEPLVTGRNKRSNTVFEVTYDPSKPLAPGLRSARAGKEGVILTVEVPDISTAGIIIFRNDGHSEDLNQISPLIPVADGRIITYIDSSRYLSSSLTYTYAVKAESRSYIRSDFSDKERVKPVSNELPSAPEGLKAWEEDGKVRLLWRAGTEDDDIAGYIVSRRVGTRSFETIAGYPELYPANYYTDSLITTGLTYLYKVEAVNMHGLKSQGGSVVTCSVETQLPIAPSSINAIITGDAIVLEWSETLFEGMENYNVYRYQPGKDPIMLTTTAKDKTTYTDQATTKGTWYYYVTTTDQRKLESPRSPEIQVVF